MFYPNTVPLNIFINCSLIFLPSRDHVVLVQYQDLFIQERVIKCSFPLLDYYPLSQQSTSTSHGPLLTRW